MIRAFFTVAGPVKLLPHFLNHYTRIGVEHFIFCAYEPSFKRYGRIAQIVDTHCLRSGVSHENGFWFHERSMDWKHRAVTIAGIVRDKGWTDWILYPDLDEFVQVPGNDLRGYLGRLPPGVQVVEGVLRDRITSTGELAEVKPNVPLDEQFPWTGDVTTNIAEESSNSIKIIVACRGVIPTTHRPGAGATKGLRRNSKPLTVDHFKWNSDCLKHLQERQKHYKVIGMPNAAQSFRLIAYLTKHGRIGVKSSRLRCRPVSRKR